MLSVINGAEDSKLAPDLGCIFFAHSCGNVCGLGTRGVCMYRGL